MENTCFDDADLMTKDQLATRLVEPTKGAALVVYVTRIAGEYGWRRLTAMNANDFATWLTRRKASGKSAANINHHIRKIKAFANWLVAEKRMVENPFANISLLNERADRRLERRALEEDEIGRLLWAADNGPVVNGMAGRERALLYQLAIETGLRWNECRALVRGDFDFDGELLQAHPGRRQGAGIGEAAGDHAIESGKRTRRKNRHRRRENHCHAH